MRDLGVLWAGPGVSFWEEVREEGEALICSGFQGITGPALVGGAGEKPLQVWVPTVFQLKPLCLHHL